MKMIGQLKLLMAHFKIKFDLVVFLPTKNPNSSILESIDSFINLNNNKSILIIVDNGEQILVEGFFEKIKKIENIVYFKLESKNKLNFVNYVEEYPDILFKVFKTKTNFPKYFTQIGDDDLLISPTTLIKAIEILDKDNEVSYVVPSVIEKNFDGKEKYFNHHNQKISNLNFLNMWFNEKYSFDLSVDESYLSHCLHSAIWRLDDLQKYECFKTLGLYKKNLWDGFGLDFTWYIKPISKKKKYIYLLGGDPMKLYNAHVDSMTSKFPIMFSYCYFSYLIHCYEWLNNKKDFIDNNILKKFIIRWINQMFSSYFAVHTLDKSEKYNSPVELYLKKSFLIYIYKQCLKFLSIKTIAMMYFWTKKIPLLKKS